MDKDKVLNLAKLARIDLDEREAESLSGEFEAILGYVSEIKNLDLTPTSSNPEPGYVRNVLRDDSDTHEAGIYTKEILEQAPSRESDYLKVKKIL